MRDNIVAKALFLGLLISLGGLLGGVRESQAAISFVSAAAASSTSVTIGTHAANDIIFMTAVRNSGTLCSLAAGWTEIASSSLSGISSRFAYKIAASGSETSGTWTNCTRLIAVVYRGQSLTTPLGGFASTTASSNSIAYSTVAMSHGDGTSWVVASGYHATANTTSGQVPPSGMVNRTETGSGTPRVGAHDSNGGVPSWPTTAVTASGSGNWVTYVQELNSQDSDATPPTPGNSGTMTTLNLFDTDFNLVWVKATDDFSGQSSIQYRVYQSSSNNIDTVANIEANGTALNSYTADIATFAISGLSPSTTYYFNVIAKDLAGNKVAYTMKSATTQAACSRNFLTDFVAGTHGNALTSGLVNSSTFGTTTSFWTVTNALGNLIFSTDGYKALGGSIQTLCSNPWPGEASSVGTSLLIDNTYSYADFDLPPAVADTVTAGYWFKSDYPSSQSGVNIDSFHIKSLTGGTDFVNVPFQVSNGSLKVGMETGSLGECTHASETINISRNTWYWITLQYTKVSDGSKGMREQVYDQDFNLIGDIPGDESRTPCNPQKATEITFGHYAVTPAENLPGAHLFFDKILVCYLGNCPFPLLPTVVSPPSVTTSLPTSVATSTLTLNSSITATGGADATQSGFAYGTVSNLATVIATTTLGAQTGTASFAQGLTSLTPNTTYYFRSYAVNSAGTSTGSILSTTTLPVSVPTVTTQAASSVGQTSATGNGTITVTGNINPTSRGVVYGTTALYGATTTSSGDFSTGAFTSAMSSLVCNTLYHVAAYATNSVGTGYGTDVTFTTSACDVEDTPAPDQTPSTTSSTGSSASGQVSNLIALGLYAQAGTIARRYGLPDPTTGLAPSSVGAISRSLGQGARGNDVRALQIFLNSRGFTLAAQGPGSPGQETSYFGPLTKAAVMKLQEAYRKETLDPQGLGAPTGFVGRDTLKLLNAFMQ